MVGFVLDLKEEAEALQTSVDLVLSLVAAQTRKEGEVAAVLLLKPALFWVAESKVA